MSEQPLALMDLDLHALEELLAGMGQPKFRAKQLSEGLWMGKTVQEMTNLPAALKEALLQNTRYGGARILEKVSSRQDGTVKYLFLLDDGEYVEGVLLPYHHGNTLCLSTQVGCRMGCAFCASTKDGLIRNLTAGEMLGQVIAANRDCGDGRTRAITNLVLMGSGEPLDNYDNTLAFLRRITAPQGLNISPRNISLSTCGIVPRIDRLAAEGLGVTLCISLHNGFGDRRSELMPINRAYPLEQVVEAARRYGKTTGRRVIFEYALIRDVNDRPEDLVRLRALLGGFPAHVNVIPLNSAQGSTLRGSSGQAAEQFAARLQQLGISATRRRTMGEDIEGACGQLRRRRMREEQQEALQ